ncbi:hypothetical protein AGMMS50218_09870 [Actinomycetota bacterium]|nr:hypothetical protein AGMMS50218_09870 [Actinomycetota bacterium]
MKHVDENRSTRPRSVRHRVLRAGVLAATTVLLLTGISASGAALADGRHDDGRGRSTSAWFRGGSHSQWLFTPRWHAPFVYWGWHDSHGFHHWGRWHWWSGHDGDPSASPSPSQSESPAPSPSASDPTAVPSDPAVDPSPSESASAPSTGGPSTGPGTGPTTPVPPTGPGTPSTPPSQPPSTTTGCAPVPSRCGYPDSTNSGYAPGSQLAKVPEQVQSGQGWTYDSRGWISAGDGAVVENIETSVPINLSGNGAVVRNVWVNVDGDSWGIGLQHTVNATIQDSRIGPPDSEERLGVAIKDVYGDASGTRVIGNEILNISTGIQTHEGLIEDNYIHRMALLPGDHVNGTTSNGSQTQLTIRHNTIFNQHGQTDAVSLFQDFGVEANRLITDNLLAGGGYTIYGGAGGKGATSNIQITDNRIARLYFRNGGSYGPVTAFDSGGRGNVWSNNVWDDTGLQIPSP